MNTLLFGVDLIFVVLSAWIIGFITYRKSGGALELLLAVGVYVVVLIVGSGVMLGAVGFFDKTGFLVLHAGVFCGLVVLNRRELPMYWAGVRMLGTQLGSILNQDWRLRWGALAIGVFLVGTGFLAMLAEPAIYDSLTYRLSRVAHWLQEGRIGFITTNDPRQNYMPVVPDIVMAWLLGAVAKGYAGAALAQWAGGILMLLATLALARHFGLGRVASLGVVLLALGMANVTVQFTTSQTDLFTSGLVASAFFLFISAARRQCGSVTAGLAAGLALGAKGTVFYFLPSLLIWAVWYGRRYRLPVAGWRRTVLAAGAAIMVFVAPGLVRNWCAYGGVFGPPEFVAMHHQGGLKKWPEKTLLNLRSSLTQSFDPNSQMFGVRVISAKLGTTLAARLPERDSFTFENGNRRGMLMTLMARRTPDADATTMGVLPLVLLASAMVFSLFTIKAGEARIITLGLILFLVFFHAMQQWHPYGFRYFILVVPWICILIVGWIRMLPKHLHLPVWFLLFFSSATVAWHTLANTHNAAWPAASRPDVSVHPYIYRAWRGWLAELSPEGDSMYVALPFNRQLAPFYRRGLQQQVKLVSMDDLAGISAEQAVGSINGKWLITGPLQFAGNEGRVIRKVWLFRGEAASPYSLVAYRRVEPGE